MAGDRKPNDYRWARQSGALLVVSTLVFVLIVDTLRSDFETEPLVLIPLLIFTAGLLGVDVNLNNSRGLRGTDKPDKEE